jgi:molybdopterin-guanine dinucleotide biosynthesis protein A
MFAALAADGELAVAHNGERLQPVFALLRRDLRDSLRAYLGRGERKIDRWFGVHRMTVVDFSDCPTMFRNINTPADLEALELLMKGDSQ